jgi:predicted nucleic acid-binding protein
VFLIDTHVISEDSEGPRANAGVIAFFRQATDRGDALVLSVITVGELRRGAELIRHRANAQQALTLESWLNGVLDQYRQYLLDFDGEAAQVWGRLLNPSAAG